jgi:adenosylcobinamide-GDP ribazoletransferase
VNWGEIMLRRFAVALSFLTFFRLPVSGEITPADLGRCYGSFPLVGLLVGAATALPAMLLRSVMPPLLLAAWACAFMALVTRGFHLDGLADLADGLGGGFTPARRLEIMRDSATGAFGSLALVLAVVLKTGAIHAIILANGWPALVVVPSLGRFAMVVAAYGGPCARADGLAKSGVEHMTRWTMFGATLSALFFSMLLVRKLTPAFVGVAVVSAFAMRVLARRRLGGITGDVLGAVNECTEVFLFTLAACMA